MKTMIAQHLLPGDHIVRDSVTIRLERVEITHKAPVIVFGIPEGGTDVVCISFSFDELARLGEPRGRAAA